MATGQAEHHRCPFLKQHPAAIPGESPGAATPAGKCCQSLCHVAPESEFQRLPIVACLNLLSFPIHNLKKEEVSCGLNTLNEK